MKIVSRVLKSGGAYYQVKIEKDDAMAKVLVQDVQKWADEQGLDVDFTSPPYLYFSTEEEIALFIMRWA